MEWQCVFRVPGERKLNLRDIGRIIHLRPSLQKDLAPKATPVEAVGLSPAIQCLNRLGQITIGSLMLSASHDGHMGQFNNPQRYRYGNRSAESNSSFNLHILELIVHMRPE